MLTDRDFKAALAMLGWSVRDAADKLGNLLHKKD